MVSIVKFNTRESLRFEETFCHLDSSRKSPVKPGVKNSQGVQYEIKTLENNVKQRVNK